MKIRVKTAKNITIDTAKKLAIIKQCLHERPTKINNESILDIINQIGILQLDSINVVQRSHYITMFSRLGCYNANIIDELQFPEKKISEQWVHVASLIPHSDLINIRPEILKRRKEGLTNRQLRTLGNDYNTTLKKIVAQIQAKGPVSASAFKEINPNKGSWWSKKPARVALDVLFRRGEIGIAYRKNFKCYYNIQDVYKKKVNKNNIVNYYKWATLKSINAMGIATIDQISDYYRISIPHIRTSLLSLQKEDKVEIINIKGLKDVFYTTGDNISIIKKVESGKIKCDLTTVLSPFDNLIWHRNRVKLLFDFYYKSEMYTPGNKRLFGYYVLPILHHNNLIGRVDPKFDRKTKTLFIHSISLEKNCNYSNYTIDCISKALLEFAKFLNAKKIKFSRKSSNPLMKQLITSINKYENKYLD